MSTEEVATECTLKHQDNSIAHSQVRDHCYTYELENSYASDGGRQSRSSGQQRPSAAFQR